MKPWLLLAQGQNEGGGAAGAIGALIYLAVIVAIIVGFWKLFEKAGKPGWASIIPVYNWIVLLEIIGKPIWWIILFFIPCVNIIIFFIVVPLEVAKCFGKSVGFAIGLILLPFVFYPILGFSDARYVGPSAPAV